ncbi:hypothetical protein J5N97_006234 [Dioscorea zingiberensis]|uniref:Plastocyanin-like domain-containing protein n=1 Tax=Dioscorea zingiberensis TaxID=325984 RepID=A0A9D5DBJ5_9LILI|nr:hypothetical protein J5N97_006234 [Dioscorea zingiberensis]
MFRQHHHMRLHCLATLSALMPRSKHCILLVHHRHQTRKQHILLICGLSLPKSFDWAATNAHSIIILPTKNYMDARAQESVDLLELQVPKIKLADRINAHQQTVSSFGKTDTASVLMEAINYIRFLEEQVQLLSDPYMKLNGNMLNYLVVGNESPSILICFSLKTNNARQITSKLHVIELGAQSDHHYYHLAFFTTRKVEAYEELTWVFPGAWTAILVSLDNVAVWNLRTENLDTWYLGQEVYIKVVNPENTNKTQLPLPVNALYCGRLKKYQKEQTPDYKTKSSSSVISANDIARIHAVVAFECQLLCGLTAMDCAVGLLFALQPIFGGSSGLFHGIMSMAKLCEGS